METRARVILSDSDIKALVGGVWKGFSKGEIEYAKKLCETHQLNPLTNEIYIIARGKGANRRLMAQVSIDGFRIMAGKHPDYAGQTAPLWCGPDGQWRDVWLEDGPPAACKIGIRRRGIEEPTWTVLTWKEYAPNAGRVAKSMPALMIAKATESLGIRKAFPETFSGLYTTEELDAEGKEPMKPMVVKALATLAAAAGLDADDISAWASTQPASMAGAALEKMVVRLVESIGELPDDTEVEATFLSDTAAEIQKAVKDDDEDALAEAVNRAIAYVQGRGAAV